MIIPIRLQPDSIVVDCAVPAETAGSATADSLPSAEETQAGATSGRVALRLRLRRRTSLYASWPHPWMPCSLIEFEPVYDNFERKLW